ncbi:hypothetical protein HCN51_39350 [Nonomuraea sp. FMUSA5-5]|uniref:MobA-like NTP transferase domain-containing protein n=1 Tax=Nonomuraea composti TaxID=2720023 RepID=A0ABX1BKW2_9ACTN|nr:2-C-methyl-D-erythritol 4-phosphate cytidylyltransferase [Nonomuraea sp. FMUSA5-5]NJP95428.1 hypothetical protein [Nonomuraea sp. FMUSA5-5]
MTVIVPCAGAGTRLGLPIPKELLPIGTGRVAIDGVFDLIRAARTPTRVALVVDDHRAATLAHVHQRHRDVPVAAVRQRAESPELAGALESALEWASERVLVLLPDQVLSAPPPGFLLDEVLAALERAPACVLAAREDDPARIAMDGALCVDDTMHGRRVCHLVDKPGMDAAEQGRFNAVWFGLAFRREAAQQVIDQLAEAAEPPLGGSPVIEVPPFTDLGTWPSLLRYWKDLPCA